MSGIGTGYDLSATTFSPDGRVFQIEYAEKAVESSGTVVGVAVKNGIVFGVEKYILSKMLYDSSIRRVFTVDDHIGMAVAGLLPDGRALVRQARKEAKSYYETYGHRIPVRVLADRVGMYIQAYTLYASVRPFGCSVILGSSDDGFSGHPQLFTIEPSGIVVGCYGSSLGKGRTAGKTQLERLNFRELSVREAVREVAKIIHSVHDDVRDKDFRLEMSWMSSETDNQPQLIPQDVIDEAEAWAKSKIEEDEEGTMDVE